MKRQGSTVQSPTAKISRQEASDDTSFEGFCLQYGPEDYLSDKDSSISADVIPPIDTSTISPSNSPDDVSCISDLSSDSDLSVSIKKGSLFDARHKTMRKKVHRKGLKKNTQKVRAEKKGSEFDLFLARQVKTK
mmetsp:Transcript_15110/g.22066  ORF Transcript_15110/g.22066 Transcript_15110/m.22066 type:complete len:134 (-) Transcript_15110:1675-2076(-)